MEEKMMYGMTWEDFTSLDPDKRDEVQNKYIIDNNLSYNSNNINGVQIFKNIIRFFFKASCFLAMILTIVYFCDIENYGQSYLYRNFFSSMDFFEFDFMYNTFHKYAGIYIAIQMLYTLKFGRVGLFSTRKEVVWISNWPSTRTGSDSNHGNIDDIVRYRDSLSGMLTPNEAASMYNSTAWLDGARNSSSPKTQDTVNYINARLGSMTPEAGMNWLRGNKK